MYVLGRWMISKSYFRKYQTSTKIHIVNCDTKKVVCSSPQSKGELHTYVLGRGVIELNRMHQACGRCLPFISRYALKNEIEFLEEENARRRKLASTTAPRA